MKMQRLGKAARTARWRAACTFAIVLAGGFASPAAAADSTGKPIRLIVPFSPGGSSDLVARLLADKLKDGLPQRVVIDNRAGAGGMLGTELGAKAPPDGQTLLLAYTGTFSISPALYPKIAYDPVADFAPITLVTTSVYLLVVHPTLPVASVKELIALAAKRPGELNYGSAGNGSAPHLAGALFQSMARVSMQHVPYKGGAPAMIDVLAGQLEVYFASGPISIPHVKSKRLKLLAATSAVRSKLYPDVPTIAEAGVKGYEMTSWYGVVVPAKTPKPTIDALYAAITDAVKRPDFAEQLAVQGIEPAHTTPSELAALIGREIPLYAKIVKEAKVRPE
jgi:tripartite-type tricarboxylate transporter receptor subunit TctC